MTGAYLYELGVTPYREALETMTDLAAARSQGAVPDTVMLLEHEPVITLGSRAVRGEELLMAAVEYTRRGIEVVEVSRGGRSTYHGPGSSSATRCSTCTTAARTCTAMWPTSSRW